ncbi:hypothetical protein BBJK_01591 [Bifidobacterium bifidum LMG 13195]|uniref:Uncharacterized protein n=1 Tax=Bifidobacterium bifidum LMG 13195 TaxID=1207542 RepID=A0A286TD13_BIFBI|nr:hypothetical protein BBJK_01591 [Bifidobacterium bifidum LMG 13195]
MGCDGPNQCEAAHDERDYGDNSGEDPRNATRTPLPGLITSPRTGLIR